MNTPDTEKEKIYTILDKMYANKSYIDCAYEDIKELLHQTRQEAILEGQRIEKDNLLSMVDEFHDEIDFEEMAQMVRRVVQHCKQESTLPVTEK